MDEDFAHKLFLMYTESGFYVKLIDQVKKSCVDFIRKENRFYRTLKEYVDDLISFDNLGIGNFYGIFKSYFVFCSIMLIIFVIHHTNKKKSGFWLALARTLAKFSPVNSQARTSQLFG